jgi:hypothetical protein
VEHLSKSLSIVGHINSAPRNFTVYVSEEYKLNRIHSCEILGFER